jgi:hypothetical protein
MTRFLSVALLLASPLSLTLTASAQREGLIPTQVLVGVDPKSTPPADASALTVQVDDRKEPLTAWTPLTPANVQVALLIDDGLREAVGRELDNLRNFVRNLPPGVEVMVGFMQNGRVVAEQPFTTDHDQVASTLHLPQGMVGASASPYICLSDFVSRWHGSEQTAPTVAGFAPQRKARFAIMITNGVDPYNGSTSVMNQDSPYVQAAVADAQRAGVVVSSIYFGDAGMRGGSADNSGQNYLQELTQGTGGTNFWQGVGNPVSTAPFLAEFQRTIAETYVATFPAPTGKNPDHDLVHIKFSAGKTRLRAPSEVLPGNQE